jgi:RNA polymerase-binding transcription factor DksA
MKRQKKLTKRERKAQSPGRPQAAGQHQHIHCIACGRHIDPAEFSVSPITATMITCQHGSQFASCVTCTVQSQLLIDTHDRTNLPVKAAQAYH